MLLSALAKDACHRLLLCGGSTQRGFPMKKQSPVKIVRSGAFGLIIIFFFLPFVLISCPGKNSVPVKGIELVTGKVISGKAFSPFTDNQRVPPHGYAIAALVCAIAGVVLSFLKPKPAFILCLLAGVVGLVCLMLLKNQISANAAQHVADGLRVYYRSGYWTAIAGFAVALVITLVLNPFMKGKLQVRKIFKRKTGRKRRR
jgi:hypothetical protein